jgi:ATP-dependent helicase/nuclease subunit A
MRENSGHCQPIQPNGPQSSPTGPQDRRPTEQQKIALDPSVSVWVEASAGSGKTTVLAQRLVRLLLNGTPAHRILCMTFSSKAAQEMQARVGQLLDQIDQSPGQVLAGMGLDQVGAGQPKHGKPENEQPENEQPGNGKPDNQGSEHKRLGAGWNDDHQIDQSDSKILDRARSLKEMWARAPAAIQTFHSFCHDLLARFPLEAHVQSPLTVLTDFQSAQLWDQACARVLEVGSATARGLVPAAAKGSFEDFARDPSLAAALTLLAQEGKDLFERLQSARYDRSAKTLSKTLSKRSAIQKPPSQEGPIQGISNQGTPSQEPPIQEAWLADGSLASLALKDDLSPNRPLAESPPRHCSLENEAISDTAVPWRQVVDHVRRVYTTLKSGALDYDDLIDRALQLTDDPSGMGWVGHCLDCSLDHVLIDEAQDTTPNQWALVRFLVETLMTSPEKTLFVVGDPKQSIYGFQGARLDVFFAMRDFVDAWITQHGGQLVRVSLSASFRMAPAILDLVNAVFDKVALTSDPFPVHQAGRPLAVGSVCVMTQEDLMEEVVRQKIQPRLDRAAPETCGSTADQAMLVQGARVQGGLNQEGLVHSSPAQGSPAQGSSAQGAPAQQEVVQTRGVDFGATQRPLGQASDRPDLAHSWALRLRDWVDNPFFLPSQGRLLCAQDILILCARRTQLFQDVRQALIEQGFDPVSDVRACVDPSLAGCVDLARWILCPGDDGVLWRVLESFFPWLEQEALVKVAWGRRSSLFQALTLFSRPAVCEQPDDSCGGPKQDNVWAGVVRQLTLWLSLRERLSPHALMPEILYACGGLDGLRARHGASADRGAEVFLGALQAWPARQGLEPFLRWISDANTVFKAQDVATRVGLGPRLMTVHGSKGLQAPVVVIPDLSPPFGPETDEYWRLLYVALTRAQDRLYCAYHPKSRGWAKRVAEASFKG